MFRNPVSVPKRRLLTTSRRRGNTQKNCYHHYNTAKTWNVELRLIFAALTARYSFFPSRIAVGFVDEKLEHIVIYYFMSQFLAIFMKQIGWYATVILGACLCLMRLYTEFGIMSFDEDPNANHMAASLCINENCLQMMLVSMKQCRTTMNLWYHHDSESSSTVTGKRFLWSLRTNWCMLTNFY